MLILHDTETHTTYRLGAFSEIRPGMTFLSVDDNSLPYVFHVDADTPTVALDVYAGTGSWDLHPLCNLTSLQLAADMATIHASDDMPQFSGEAINWADLDCVLTETILDNEGNIHHRVYIEEADPSSHRLAKFIADYLVDKGYTGIEVLLEW